MIQGKGIAKDHDLHVIDMRQIAPTFAQLLNVKLPEAKLPSVSLNPGRKRDEAVRVFREDSQASSALNPHAISNFQLPIHPFPSATL